jgi:hypothetical protein
MHGARITEVLADHALPLLSGLVIGVTVASVTEGGVWTQIAVGTAFGCVAAFCLGALLAWIDRRAHGDG